MNAKQKTLMLVCLPLTLNAAAQAASTPFAKQKITVDLSLGALNGETKARLYNPEQTSQKTNETIWKYRNAAIVQGAFDWDVAPQLTVSARGWTTLGSRGGNMTDKEWDSDNQNALSQTSYPNSRLNFANQLDLGVKGWLFNYPDWRLGLMAGYQQSRSSFNARGGVSDEENNTLPADAIARGFKQQAQLPYIGLLGQYRYHDMEFGGAFKYSGWVKTTAKDLAYRDLMITKSEIHHQRYYSLSAYAGYHLTEHAKIVLEGSWDRLASKKGTVTVSDYTGWAAGEYGQGSFANAGSMEATQFITRIGVSYAF